MAKVLIIEDNPANMTLATFLLQSAGHSVLAARDAEKAWQAASRPCSIEVEASAGNPITSPAAKMPGTLVSKAEVSTGTRLFSSATPQFATGPSFMVSPKNGSMASTSTRSLPRCPPSRKPIAT